MHGSIAHRKGCVKGTSQNELWVKGPKNNTRKTALGVLAVPPTVPRCFYATFCTGTTNGTVGNGLPKYSFTSGAKPEVVHYAVVIPIRKEVVTCPVFPFEASRAEPVMRAISILQTQLIIFGGAHVRHQ
jgi:hypothetical protein